MWKHPDMQVQLQLSVDPPAYGSDSFDVCIRFGEPPDGRIIARRLASNRRMLCAAPAYLARHGAPAAPKDLERHQCIRIEQGGEASGVWRLTTERDGSRRAEEPTSELQSPMPPSYAVFGLKQKNTNKPLT